ncbi:MAG: hypothetical protein COA77_03270 [Thaumarchaeota archaeon]|nr:MAG: hypothetical protein COA77_03270 [Nitrososphaerota archaeon]
MSEKIIFWLDSDITNFGIAKFLQEKYTCELFSIIDITNRTKKFFVNQQLVKFKKSWYYFDYVLPEKNIDIDYLIKFEKKFGINLWLLALNERLFYNYNNYYKFNQNEILSILEKECKLFEQILQEIKPDFLIIKTTDLHHNHLLYEMCRTLGVKVMMLESSRFGHRCIITQERDTIDYVSDLGPSLTKNRTLKDLQNIIFSKNLSTQLESYKNQFISSKQKRITSIFNFIFLSKNTNLQSHYTYFGRSKFKVFLTQFYYALIEKYRKSFIDKNLKTDLDNSEHFVYFPLHQEPERVLLIASPFYTNQFETICHLAKSLPINFKLYVKEHPTQSIRGWRELSFYKQVLEIPNVVFLHPSVPSEDIMKKSSLVVTVGGTSALEAAFYNKPSIIFKDMFYGQLSSVTTVSSLEKLPELIKQSLQNQVEVEELDKYVALIEKNSFDFDIINFQIDYANYFYFGGYYADVKISIEKMNKFLDIHKDKLEFLAEQFIKKINQHKNSSEDIENQ